MGHAAIVDRNGRVLAHPLATWVRDAVDISDVSVVQRMMAGDTGIGQFYSPALKGDMIAGFTSVPKAGWGVMIPQPVSELHLEAYEALKPIYLIIGGGLALAMVTALFLSGRIADPLERITSAARKANQTGDLEEIPEDTRAFIPAEPLEIISAYNGMVQAVRSSEEHMRELAYSDNLTGLLNRAAFTRLVGRCLSAQDAPDVGGALLHFDLDDFKAINDAHGHALGDKVLVEIATRVSRLVEGCFGVSARNNPLIRTVDDHSLKQMPLFARFGGDEFTLLLPGLCDRSAIERFSEAMISSISRPIDLGSAEIRPATSVGVTLFPQDCGSVDVLLHRADVALYHAKSRGKSQWCLYEPDKGVQSAFEIQAEVSAAIAAGQMELHYQPKIDTASGGALSAEALVRWRHPSRGLVPPVAFIPHIENSAVVVELGEWVLRQAANDIRNWTRNGRTMKVALNIAARHFLEVDFAERATAIIKTAGVEASSFELEITEEAAMAPLDDGRDVIGTLKQNGFRVALDDYGRGYSNLSRLAQLRIDTIKIDRSLIDNVTENERTRKIVTATVAMAESLDCRVVGEGVETSAMAMTLARIGCHELQGYYFSKPLPKARFEEWLDARAGSRIVDLTARLAKAL